MSPRIPAHTGSNTVSQVETASSSGQTVQKAASLDQREAAASSPAANTSSANTFSTNISSANTVPAFVSGQATAKATSEGGNTCNSRLTDFKEAADVPTPVTFGQPAQNIATECPQPAPAPVASSFGTSASPGAIIGAANIDAPSLTLQLPQTNTAVSAQAGNDNKLSLAPQPTTSVMTAEIACQTTETGSVVQLQPLTPFIAQLVQLSYQAAPLESVGSLPSWLDPSQQDAAAVVVTMGTYFQSLVMAFAAAGMLDMAASVMDKVSSMNSLIRMSGLNCMIV